jgi:uncharacterized protein YbjT (DUF2867 family)
VAVRGYARDRLKASALLGEEADIVIGDFSDPKALRDAMAGSEAVFVSCANDPRQVELETNVIDAAAESDVSRLVKLSADGARVGSPLAFWDANARVENHLREVGLPAVVLRPGFYMTNLIGSAETIKHAGQFFLPAGDAPVALTDPRDVAAAAVMALTTALPAGQTFRISGPEALTFTEVAAQLSTAVGSTVKYVDVPDVAARAAMAEVGLPDWLADNLIAVFGRIRQGDLATVTDDYRALTGREPRSFSDFARDHAALFRT